MSLTTSRFDMDSRYVRATLERAEEAAEALTTEAKRKCAEQLDDAAKQCAEMRRTTEEWFKSAAEGAEYMLEQEFKLKLKQVHLAFISNLINSTFAVALVMTAMYYAVYGPRQMPDMIMSCLFGTVVPSLLVLSRWRNRRTGSATKSLPLSDSKSNPTVVRKEKRQ